MIKKENETKLHDGLCNILKEHLIWNKAHLDCFIGMLFSLLHLKQINLTQLALAFPSDAKLSSRYRRLQRFFQKVSFDYLDKYSKLPLLVFFPENHHNHHNMKPILKY